MDLGPSTDNRSPHFLCQSSIQDIVFVRYHEKLKITGISLQCQVVTSPTNHRIWQGSRSEDDLNVSQPTLVK